MRMRVIALGDKEFDLDGEFAAPAIAAAISGESGEDVRSEVIDYTDTERSDIDRDEYAIVSDASGVLWQGWLGSGQDDVPPPVAVPGSALAQGATAQLAAERDKYLHQLAQVIRMCENPVQTAGRTSGSGVVNGVTLASRILDVIGGAQ